MYPRVGRDKGEGNEGEEGNVQKKVDDARPLRRTTGPDL